MESISIAGTSFSCTCDGGFVYEPPSCTDYGGWFVCITCLERFRLLQALKDCLDRGENIGEVLDTSLKPYVSNKLDKVDYSRRFLPR